MWVYNPFLIIHLSFAFLLGAAAAKYKVFEHKQTILSRRSHIGSWFTIKGQWLILLIALVTLKCSFETSAFNNIYAFGIIYLFLRIPRWRWIDKILAELGNKSMDMWMIHSWFCYYLFHDWIYIFRYPMVIMVILIIVSYLCSLVVNKIANIIK